MTVSCAKGIHVAARRLIIANLTMIWLIKRYNGNILIMMLPDILLKLLGNTNL